MKRSKGENSVPKYGLQRNVRMGCLLRLDIGGWKPKVATWGGRHYEDV